MILCVHSSKKMYAEEQFIRQFSKLPNHVYIRNLSSGREGNIGVEQLQHHEDSMRFTYNRTRDTAAAILRLHVRVWERGITGGEETSLVVLETRGGNKFFVPLNAMALLLLEGMEKLRETITGGAGRGDALEGILLAVEDSSFPNTSGAEWPTKPEDFAGLIPGGRGSSWSSPFLGEETGGGEVLGETFRDEEGWVGRERIPETGWSNSEEEMGPLADRTGFFNSDLLINGPEKACFLNFPISEIGPSVRGGGSWDKSFCLPSLSSNAGFDLCFLCSRREEWDKLRVAPRPVGLLCGPAVPFPPLGVGNTYESRSGADKCCICLIFSAGSYFFSVKIGAEWLLNRCSLFGTSKSAWFLSKFTFIKKNWIECHETMTESSRQMTRGQL